MSLYDIEVEDIDGNFLKLQKYKGKVLLIVNVASKCGFTPQYEELELLHKEYASQGLAILAFPCNQFLSQEPGNNEAIKEFCSLSYGVEFDLFAKVDVNGENTHPLFEHLKKEAGGLFGKSIKWNFTKFLVDRNGVVVKRYAPMTKPKNMREDIVELLKI
jgi:glutathione peroxidase